MKPFRIVLGLTLLSALAACALKSEPQSAPATPQTSAPETPTPGGVLSTNYIQAASALAADDFDKAKDSLAALAKEGSGEMQAQAKTAADAADLAAMRESFKILSATATKMELPPDYAVVMCPMYKGGAKWVQKKEGIANPYFGKSMSTCGSFVN